MTWTTPPGVRNTITKTAVTAVLLVIPTAAVSIPACATPGVGGTPSGLLAPLPADPPTDAPAPPPPPAPPQQNYEYYNPNDWYNYGGDGGGGGGGG
jgi:hypothetical protein